MYSFTLPHKAFAAGDTIPVAVKFSPLAKGVRIVSLITTIREHTYVGASVIVQLECFADLLFCSTVYSKSSSHSEARDATTVKYSFIEGGSNPPSATPSGMNTPGLRFGSTASLSSMGGPATPTTPGFNSPIHGSRTPAIERGGNDGYPFHMTRPGRRARFQLGADEEDDDAHAHNPTQASTEAGPAEEDDGQDTEVDVVVDVQVPVWTAPSHSVHPVFVNHKIKWSAFIKNPDGHVSELRCALPIHILASNLQEEARLASAGSRNLLFGPSGALAHSDVPQVDLPSYQDHIMDRVANADTAAQYSASSGFAPTPWSSRTTPTGTPGVSPPASRPPSRPASPERRSSHSERRTSHHSSFGGFGGFSALSSINRSGTSTPATSSPPPELADDAQDAHPEDHRNWVDSELLSTLNLNEHVSPPSSAPASRPGSRPSSRPSSRAGSRASSPDRTSIATSIPVPSTPPTLDERPALSRSHNSGSFFNLHIPKPLRPLTSFSRNSSASNLRDALHMSSHSHGHPSTGGSDSRRPSTNGSDSGAPSPSALSSALAAHAARAGPSGHVARPPLAVDTPSATVIHAMMSNSPHGRSTGSAGGASPISASPAQPSPLLSPGISGNANFHLHYGSITSPASTPGLGPGTPLRVGRDGSTSPSLLSSSAPSPGPPPHGQPVDVLSQVPSYDVAARGFLGGGVVPLSFNPPNYDEVCPSTDGSRAASPQGARPSGEAVRDAAPGAPPTATQGQPAAGLQATDFGGLSLGVARS